jgi:hypothetical protein
MPAHIAKLTALALLGITIGCGSAANRPTPVLSAQEATRSNSSTIIAEDLQKTMAPNLYQAIQALHPEWFRRPGATPIQGSRSYGVAVFVDRTRAGGVEVLEQTSVSNAAYVRYYSASEAQMRFGEGVQNGVIQIVTQTGSKRP